MNKIFYFPLLKDWLFYYSIVNLINLLSSVLDISSNPLITDFASSISRTFIGYLIFWGLPIYIRIKLKQRNLKMQLINPEEKVIFVSFSTDDRLIVNKVITELKKNTNLNIWMQEHIQGGHDGEEVIKEKIQQSFGSLVFFSNNSFQSPFINETEIPLLKQKQLESEEYFIIPLRVGKTDPDFLEQFSELQTIPSKSQTISRSNSIEFKEIINKIADSIPERAKFNNIKNQRRDISKILTFFGWILALTSLVSTVLPQNQLNNLFQIFNNDSNGEYLEYVITSDPANDICTLWLQNGRQQLNYRESLLNLIVGTETLDEEIQFREELLNEYKIYLLDMERVVDYHAESSYKYIQVAQSISGYIQITLEQLSTESYYSGDSLENREKVRTLYDAMIENEVIVNKFCFENGFEVSPMSLMDSEERFAFLEEVMKIEP